MNFKEFLNNFISLNKNLLIEIFLLTNLHMCSSILLLHVIGYYFDHFVSVLNLVKLQAVGVQF